MIGAIQPIPSFRPVSVQPNTAPRNAEIPAPADLLVIGGGINGCAVARDAAGRGLSVVLAEQGDLAQGTSSASSKLIHGGLRYLEQYEFRLVRGALAEREVLLASAPHLVRPLRFVLPHNASMRPGWMIRIGLFFYDHMGGRKRLPGSYGFWLRGDPAGVPLKSQYRRAFSYADCRTDDARLVVTLARDAAERGASILTRARVESARREGGQWRITLGPQPTGAPYELRARAIVNAAGPWIGGVVHAVFGSHAQAHLRLVKGSHLVFPKLYEGDFAYILQNTDRRVVFAIPYLERYTLVGTTDVPFSGDPAQVTVDPAEEQYLCDAINRYFQAQVGPEQAVWRFAGVRPLAEDAPPAGQSATEPSPATVSRDWKLELDVEDGRAPVLSLIGGKLTAHREIAEHVLKRLQPFLPRMRGPWTRRAPLPGGDIPREDLAAFKVEFRARHAWLPPELAGRWVDAYGTRADRVIGNAVSLEALGRHFGAGLYQREVEYLAAEEWARTAQDVLWRRTKLGLELSAAEAAALDDWLAHEGRASARW
jgi:glycerol-3-phosphate dehydrogenase